MTYVFGIESKKQLATCHPLLQKLANEVIKYVDCKCWEGRRSVEQQAINYAKRVSWTMNSKHVTGDKPSLAMDLSYWPMVWTDTSVGAINKHHEFGGFVKGVAAMLGIPIIWGGDWQVQDLVHFELVI